MNYVLRFLPLLTGGLAAYSAEKPNVLWIISDDLGPELGCYDYAGVATPNIDRLATGGYRFTHAFATAPVCSSSRSAFQTGRYQTSIHCQHHLTRDKRTLPDGTFTVNDLMRQAGYFISHGRGIKGDQATAKFGVNYLYNADSYFDGRDWSEPRPGQPFFAQVHIGEPHRAFVKRQGPRASATIPPYYPDHPITRADWANYLTSIERLDAKVGQILERLENEGLRESTLVIFFGDHGRPHVRDKQWLYEGGLHTPLIISWPARITKGKVKTGLTSLLDLLPTTLAAAGMDPPSTPGQNLLANDWKGHSFLFAARDRCGDAIDRIRSARNNRYKYIRNYHPEKPYLQHSGYKKLQYPVLTLMKVLHHQGSWTSPFMASTKPKEELYDLNADPYELNNLATHPNFSKPLEQLRARLDDWIEETHDQGELDEAATVDLPAILAEKRKYDRRKMEQRGLDPDLSDTEYLDWWREELNVNE